MIDLMIVVSLFWSSPISSSIAQISAPTKVNGRDEICKMSDDSLVSSVDIDFEPEWFFRPFPSGDKIAFASDKHNYFLDLTTKKATKVPGEFDALPLSNGKNWIFPSGKFLQFRTLDQGRDGKSVYEDKQMVGYYQSAGQLRNESGDHYRVVMDTTGGATIGIASPGRSNFIYQDYEISADGRKVKAEMNSPKSLCSNLKGKYSLPMISKTADRMAFFNVKSGRTEIFKLSLDGTCELERSLGQGTGKVDFSFDGKSIVYHSVEHNDTSDGNALWFKTPHSKMVSNVWVTQLETGKTKQITHFTDTNAVYPAFDKSGRVLVRKYREGGSTILTYDPALEKRSLDESFLSDPVCKDSKSFTSLAILGHLFSQMCLNGQKLDITKKVLLAKSMDKISCERLAHSFFQSKKREKDLFSIPSGINDLPEKYEKTEIKDLLEVCPQEESHGKRLEIQSQLARAPADLNKTPIAMQRCLKCHGADSAIPIPFDNADSLQNMLTQKSKFGDGTLSDEMLSRVEARSVPPANNLGARQLTDSEATVITEWLRTARSKASH